MQLDNAVNNLDNVEQIDSDLSALSSIDSELAETEVLDADMLEVVGVSQKIDEELSLTSTNAVQNRAITAEINSIKETYATKDFVEENGGKIDSISVNGVQQEIVNKNVNIEIPEYETAANVEAIRANLQGQINNIDDSISNVAKDLENIAEDLGLEIDETNKKFNDYAKLEANQTFTGSQTIVGNLTIEGNITQNGENYITQAEKVETEDDYILMRKGATGGLGSGYSGFEVENYNGAGDNARLVVDTNGIARVGDVGDEQPLLTREETTDLADGEVLVWNATTNRAEGSKDFAKANDVDTKLANKRNITNNASKLYATDSAGNQTEVSYGTGLSANLIVQRGAGGQIATTDPTADVHVVNLKTMNAALEEKYQELYDMIPDVVRRI